MRRPSLRAMAVAAGFFGVSVIVAGTASGVVSDPIATPVASAVELHQPDPATLTPAVQAGGASDDAPLAPPVEVAASAIECSEAGVCDRTRIIVPESSTPNSEASPPAADAVATCARPEPPARPAYGTDLDERTRALEQWAERWHAAARECGWDGDEWREVLDNMKWSDDDEARGTHPRGQAEARGHLYVRGPESHRERWADSRGNDHSIVDRRDGRGHGDDHNGPRGDR